MADNSSVEYGEFKQMIRDVHEDVKEIKVDVKRQNSRISKLEIWRARIVGMFVVIGAVVAYLFK